MSNARRCSANDRRNRNGWALFPHSSVVFDTERIVWGHVVGDAGAGCIGGNERWGGTAHMHGREANRVI